MLTPQADGNTRLDHFEHFRGLLTGLILSGAAEPTRQGFEAMNQAMAAQLKSATAAV
jgi:hypothetical protein